MPELSSRVLAEVERLMGERGLSGRALAAATGIPQRTLADKLAGRTALSLDELSAIGRALAVSAADLVSIGLAIMADADAGTLPPGQLTVLDALDQAEREEAPVPRNGCATCPTPTACSVAYPRPCGRAPVALATPIE